MLAIIQKSVAYLALSSTKAAVESAEYALKIFATEQGLIFLRFSHIPFYGGGGTPGIAVNIPSAGVATASAMAFAIQ